MRLTFSENILKYVILQQNGDLKKYYGDDNLTMMDKYINNYKIMPECVLDIGCGIGRVSVYFFKKHGWLDTHFYLLDGDSGEDQVGGINYDGKEDFYNSMKCTKEYCEINGLFNYTLVNIEEENIPKKQFDFVYSSFAVGFHWPVSLYLERLKNKLCVGASLLFTVRSDYPKKYRVWNKKQFDHVNSFKCYEFMGTYACGRTKAQVMMVRYVGGKK